MRCDGFRSQSDEDAVDSQSKAEVLAGVSNWMMCSMGMLVFNKLAIESFAVPCTLVAGQFAFTVLVVITCQYNSIHIGSWQDVFRWIRVVPFFTGMILTSILALSKAPMSLVITLRGMSPVLSLAVERFYPNPIQLTVPVLLSLAVGLFGIGLYIGSLPSANIDGVFWAVLNNFLAVGDRLLQRLMLAKDQDPVDISRTGAMLLNDGLGLIPLVSIALVIGEFRQVPEAVAQLDALKVFWMLASCVVGVGISYTGIWAQALITATSFLVLVNANKFFVVFVEACFFGKDLTWLQTIGATISICSAIAYGQARDAAEAASSRALLHEADGDEEAAEDHAKSVDDDTVSGDDEATDEDVHL